MKKTIYTLTGLVVLALAGFFIYRSINSSLVYFILPSEYASNPSNYVGKRIRLGGVVEQNSINFDDKSLELNFVVTDSINRYPVSHYGAPPQLFKENTGVVVEGKFVDGKFKSDEVLVKHSEVYKPAEGSDHYNIDELRDALQ
ncbi:MAG TPA: cytochrome c maturation protein CcmE [Trueperaceae bacterium]|nr:cytochrome c maturation protein CcmE [Trueperaceae bacterium]